jgi:hypothetical protein
MDASDKTRRDLTKTVWTYYKNVTAAAQPACNLSTCGVPLGSACIISYPTYEVKYQLGEGRYNTSCSTLSTICYP